MNIIEKISMYIKNIFTKKDEFKKLEQPEFVAVQDEKESFIESLKKATMQKKEKKRVETLICEGDGLGIKKDITY